MKRYLFPLILSLNFSSFVYASISHQRLQESFINANSQYGTAARNNYTKDEIQYHLNRASELSSILNTIAALEKEKESETIPFQDDFKKAISTYQTSELMNFAKNDIQFNLKTAANLGLIVTTHIALEKLSNQTSMRTKFEKAVEEYAFNKRYNNPVHVTALHLEKAAKLGTILKATLALENQSNETAIARQFKKTVSEYESAVRNNYTKDQIESNLNQAAILGMNITR